MTSKSGGRSSGRTRPRARASSLGGSPVIGSAVETVPSSESDRQAADGFKGAAGRSAARSATAMVVPERLVGFGFRGWISGYQSGDVGCWERVWQLYDERFGARGAEAAVADLSSFAKSVSACSRRRLEVEPLAARRFGRDESLAISMVAAFQHNTCPAMRACAFALVESSMLDEVLHHASSFAVTLRTLDAVVPPAWIVNANAFVGVEPLARN